MELQLLAENEQALPIVAEWYLTEWGYLRESNDLAKTKESFSDYLNTDKIPLLVLAVESAEILGAAQLKYREMTIYPDKEHWLGGVYVSKSHRGKKIAESIIARIISLAEQLGVPKLYLQTEHLDGGLYSRLGWNPKKSYLSRLKSPCNGERTRGYNKRLKSDIFEHASVSLYHTQKCCLARRCILLSAQTRLDNY